MEAPRYPSSHRSSQTLPEILVHDLNPTDRPRMSSRSSSYSANVSTNAMPIPNAREPPPPPLPPPTRISEKSIGGGPSRDIPWQWGNSHEGTTWGRASPSIDPKSSLYGSFASRRGKSITDERAELTRERDSASTITSISEVDVRRGTYPRIEPPRHGMDYEDSRSPLSENAPPRLSLQYPLYDQAQAKASADAYDKSQLQRLGVSRRASEASPRSDGSPQVAPRSPFASNTSESSPTSRPGFETRIPLQLKPLSVPEIKQAPYGLNPFTRHPSISGPPSVISPGNLSPFGQHNAFDHRSPIEARDPTIPSIRRTMSGSGISDDTSSTPNRSERGSYDGGMFRDDEDMGMDDTSGFRRLNIDDGPFRHGGLSPGLPGGQTAGQKRRRALSPPPDGGAPPLNTVGSSSDLFSRRVSNSRMSPGPMRFHSHNPSISSTSSVRNGSHTSTLSVAASSITSMGSYGRLSPGGLSPGAISPGPDSVDSPFAMSLSCNPSPRSSLSTPTPRGPHQRALSESRPIMGERTFSDSSNHVKHHSVSRISSSFMCECCPKKPKKFDTREELEAHANEKQYECQYCPNRFKNKNEAERHQNSLHLRRHSWSCAALTGYPAAFHPSPVSPATSDVCGYCGEEYPRSGAGGIMATKQDWDVRIDHLQNVHKFAECNQTKKFFRADHFRQHLKHSHAGTSGKWTNMLENACMKEEPMDLGDGPRASISSQGGQRPLRIDEERDRMEQ